MRGKVYCRGTTGAGIEALWFSAQGGSFPDAAQGKRRAVFRRGRKAQGPVPGPRRKPPRGRPLKRCPGARLGCKKAPSLLY